MKQLKNDFLIAKEKCENVVPVLKKEIEEIYAGVNQIKFINTKQYFSNIVDSTQKYENYKKEVLELQPIWEKLKNDSAFKEYKQMANQVEELEKDLTNLKRKKDASYESVKHETHVSYTFLNGIPVPNVYQTTKKETTSENNEQVVRELKDIEDKMVTLNQEMDKMPNAEKFKQHLNIETRLGGAQYNFNYAKKTLLECDLEQLGIAAQKCIAKYTKFNEELGNVQSNLTQKIEKLKALVNNYHGLAEELRNLKQQKFLKENYLGVAPVSEYKEIKPLQVDQIKEIVARFEETKKIQEELSKEFNTKVSKKGYEFLF